MMEKILANTGLIGMVAQEKGIRSEFIRVKYYKNGRVTIEPANFRCAWCGCDNESLLVIKNGVAVCASCVNEASDFIQKTSNYEEGLAWDTVS